MTPSFNIPTHYIIRNHTLGLFIPSVNTLCMSLTFLAFIVPSVPLLSRYRCPAQIFNCLVQDSLVSSHPSIPTLISDERFLHHTPLFWNLILIDSFAFNLYMARTCINIMLLLNLSHHLSSLVCRVVDADAPAAWVCRTAPVSAWDPAAQCIRRRRTGPGKDNIPNSCFRCGL
jgi:hypothetical protein